MSQQLANANIIVVDDEPVNLTIMKLSLEEKGCKTTCFKSAEDCLEYLDGANTRNFDALITDYSMNVMDGVELIEKIKDIDPTLEVILITGDHERTIIKDALRKGAMDFLDKPLRIEKFYESVDLAVKSTLKKRKSDATEASLLAARTLGLFNENSDGAWEGIFSTIYAPKHELGGDFFEVFKTPENREVMIMGDLSGHDIQSALLSSHFIGILHGQKSSNKEFRTDILLRDYNKLLNNRRKKSSDGLQIGSSLSVCCLERDPQSTTAHLLSCGMPPLYAIEESGLVRRIFSQNQPLGWFEKIEFQRTEVDLTAFNQVICFTDGIVEMAQTKECDILSLLYHSRRLDSVSQQEFFLTAKDDLLITFFDLAKRSSGRVPIVFDEYYGNEANRIDRFQRFWKNSVNLVTEKEKGPEIDRFILACREAVINAMKHGCKGDKNKQASITIYYEPTIEKISASISDPGSGHSFNIEERERNIADMPPGHLGLVLISKLVDKMTLKNGGREVEIEVTLS